MWADFASGESGGDLVSLYAAIHGISQGDAARDVAEQVGIEVPAAGKGRGKRRGGAKATAKPAAPSPATPAPEAAARRTDRVPVVPVPKDAGEPPRAHIKRGPPERRWDYFDEAGQLLGCVYRFTTSDGGKEVLPCTYCEHPTGAREWRWISFVDPRPLYLPSMVSGQALRPEKAVLVVEGEKCADIAWEHLSRWVDVVSWPGGGKAVQKADWSLLADRRVILWPDCDAKLDKNSGELLPASRQPGITAMRKLAEILRPFVPSARRWDATR
jgi:hypothetical protein